MDGKCWWVWQISLPLMPCTRYWDKMALIVSQAPFEMWWTTRGLHWMKMPSSNVQIQVCGEWASSTVPKSGLGIRAKWGSISDWFHRQWRSNEAGTLFIAVSRLIFRKSQSHYALIFWPSFFYLFAICSHIICSSSYLNKSLEPNMKMLFAVGH